MVSAAGFGYLFVNLLAWALRGADDPPYPIQETLRKRGWAAVVAFYGGCLSVMLLAVVMRRQATALPTSSTAAVV